MARPRLPQAKAEASGAVLKNAGRFEGRKAPKRTRPIGEPYASMTDEQKVIWHELVGDMPWLHSAHRTFGRLACYGAARLDAAGEFGVAGTQALSRCSSMLGAAPVDATNVKRGVDGDEDPAGSCFSRPN